MVISLVMSWAIPTQGESMEPEPTMIFIEIKWKLPKDQKFPAKLNQIINKERILSLDGKYIGFNESSDLPAIQWVKAINNVVTFLNKNNIEWEPSMVSFISSKNGNTHHGYFILHRNYLIISTMNTDGVSTPEIFPLGTSEKLL